MAEIQTERGEVKKIDERKLTRKKNDKIINKMKNKCTNNKIINPVKLQFFLNIISYGMI